MRAKRPKKKPVLLTGNCTDKQCKKRSIYAVKLGDFWVEMCADHRGKEISMDLDKVGLYIDPDRVRPV